MDTTAISLLDLSPSTPVYEQATAVYPRTEQPTDPAQAISSETIGRTAGAWPGGVDPQRAGTARPGQPAEVMYPVAAASDQRDWVAISLGILAVVALLGLIPLWFFVYQAYSG
jgi:hypothetical protein